jgi:tetratricopeptide (TPR) repeat protein
MPRILRPLTLLWPGMPWAWLRGSRSGLLLAIAFGIALDIAVVSTWVWPALLEPRLLIGLWTATAVIWAMSTGSAVAAFPAALELGATAATESLFLQARDAYLARDWLLAETRLRALLTLSPTDGEAQLLLGTLLRRAGRTQEARRALEQLARSDAGQPWQPVITRELALLKELHGNATPHEAAIVVPLHPPDAQPTRTAAAA